jgi:hypothetical protein
MLLVLERIIIKVSGFLLDTSKATSLVIQRRDWLSRRLIAVRDELPLIRRLMREIKSGSRRG